MRQSGKRRLDSMWEASIRLECGAARHDYLFHLRFTSSPVREKGQRWFSCCVSVVCVGEEVSAVDGFFDSQMHVISAHVKD